MYKSMTANIKSSAGTCMLLQEKKTYVYIKFVCPYILIRTHNITVTFFQSVKSTFLALVQGVEQSSCILYHFSLLIQRDAALLRVRGKTLTFFTRIKQWTAASLERLSIHSFHNKQHRRQTSYMEVAVTPKQTKQIGSLVRQ